MALRRLTQRVEHLHREGDGAVGSQGGLELAQQPQQLAGQVDRRGARRRLPREQILHLLVMVLEEELEEAGDATDAIDRVSSDERELRPPQLVVRMVELPPQVALELVDGSRRRRRRAERGARGVPPFGGDGARAAAARRLDL